MEQCELLEQMKFQSVLDDMIPLIPEIDQLVIGWTGKDGMTHWTSCANSNSDILWIAECIKYDIVSEQVKED